MSSLFAGHRFVFLTRAPTPNFKAVLTRYGGVFSVVHDGAAGAAAAIADPTALALADPALIKQIDSSLLSSYAGRVYKPAFVTDSVRRGTIQPLERYLLVPSSDAAHAADAAASTAATPVAAAPAPSGAVAPASSVTSHAADSDDDMVELPAATAASAAASNNSKVQAAPSKRQTVVASAATQRPILPVAASPARSDRSDRPADFAVPALPAAQTATSKRKRSDGVAAARQNTQSSNDGDDASVGSKRTRHSDGFDSLPPLERPTPPSSVTRAPTSVRSPVPRAPVSASSKGSASASASASVSASTGARVAPSAALVSAMVQEHRRRSLEKQLAAASPARSPTRAATRPVVAPASAAEELEPDVRVAETPEEEAEDDMMHDSSAPLPLAASAELLQPADRASEIAAAVDFLESEGFSRPLIIHALLITSGSMKHARAYLHRTLTREVHCWSAEEDHIIGGHDTHQTQQLVQRLGVDAVKRRTRFLCSEDV